jgi:hypothetical protein
MKVVITYHTLSAGSQKIKKRLHLGHENAPKNQFDIEINGHMKVVMPHPLSDTSNSTPSSQI